MGRAQATVAFSRGLCPPNDPPARARSARPHSGIARHTENDCLLRELRCSVLRSVVSIVSLSLSFFPVFGSRLPRDL